MKFEVVLGVTLSELDGAIESIFVAGLEGLEDPVLEEVKQIRVLPDRIEKLAERIKKRLSLRNKLNSEKRIPLVDGDHHLRNFQRHLWNSYRFDKQGHRNGGRT